MDWPGTPRIILTPNLMEFKRLCQAMVRRSYWLLCVADVSKKIDEKSSPKSLCPQLARSLQNLTIIQKGETDVISNGTRIPRELLEDPSVQTEIIEGDAQGGLKRVGGQGDILSGSVGVLMAWGSEWVRGTYE